MDDAISRRAAINSFDCSIDGVPAESVKYVSAYANKMMSRINALPPAQPEQQPGRIFQEIVVTYTSCNTYPEYEGKPYFSIKYTENGQEFIGYGTYNPEVLSEYLKEYFMPSAEPERKTGRWIIDGHNIECDQCKVYFCNSDRECDTLPRNFCPNCGADMRGEEDG